jgi:hypothetical protein
MLEAKGALAAGWVASAKSTPLVLSPQNVRVVMGWICRTPARQNPRRAKSDVRKSLAAGLAGDIWKQEL